MNITKPIPIFTSLTPAISLIGGVVLALKALATHANAGWSIYLHKKLVSIILSEAQTPLRE